MARSDQMKVVILKMDRLYGDLIRRNVWDVWPNATVRVFQRGMDALASMQDAMPDLFVTGAKINDMDGLEHLESFVESSLPILIVTSRPDTRFFVMLRELRYDGLYDGNTEGLDNLPIAFRQAVQHHPYVSPSFVPFLQERRPATLDDLTEMEQIVLSVIGDGSDNQRAADRLGIAERTVGSHRDAIMRKLKLSHRGLLWNYALKHGYVLFTDSGIRYPGFQRRIDAHRLRLRAPVSVEPTPQPPAKSRRRGKENAR
jgi:DNA-binding NarL/FixJ family response regulator